MLISAEKITKNFQIFWKSPFFGQISVTYAIKWPSTARTKNDTKKCVSAYLASFSKKSWNSIRLTVEGHVLAHVTEIWPKNGDFQNIWKFLVIFSAEINMLT